MKSKKLALVATSSLVAAALALPLTAAPSTAAPRATTDGGQDAPRVSDALTMPWQERYADLRRQAVEQRLLQGGRGAVERVSKGAYAKVQQKGTDRIFVVLAEFGDTVHSAYPAGESDATATRVRCTTRSRSPTARPTTPRCGRPTTTGPTSRTCTSPG